MSLFISAPSPNSGPAFMQRMQDHLPGKQIPEQKSDPFPCEQKKAYLPEIRLKQKEKGQKRRRYGKQDVLQKNGRATAKTARAKSLKAGIEQTAQKPHAETFQKYI